LLHNPPGICEIRAIASRGSLPGVGRLRGRRIERDANRGKINASKRITVIARHIHFRDDLAERRSLIARALPPPQAEGGQPAKTPLVEARNRHTSSRDGTRTRLASPSLVGQL
jgi:hypothetical protein